VFDVCVIDRNADDLRRVDHRRRKHGREMIARRRAKVGFECDPVVGTGRQEPLTLSLRHGKQRGR
jgi:hypothetical protein